MKSAPHQYTNSLIHETSPYLLQHAHNPVSWYAWNDETLEKAVKENKLILVSIGYSACHWCHVMEHESFEDEAVAAIMNKHFICIKVDREERPDIDQVYMLAVQLMTGHGGWPLNCFALPDGRPVYGGTYFQKEQWKNILLNLADLYRNERPRMFDYAEKLTEGVKQAELIKANKSENELSTDILTQSYTRWKNRFDYAEGGASRAPKFPLPNNYQFLLRYVYSNVIPQEEKETLLQHIELTLQKMAYGGIYDQLGGGFSRYSVDNVWKVPHFEKMLYDNSQLVTLYCEAFQATKNPLYKQVVYETLTFVKRELTSPEGGFYSALDADSEGIEGKYYVWTKAELQTLLKEDFDLFADYYNVNEEGLWEHDSYILLRKLPDAEIAEKYDISEEVLTQKINQLKSKLLVVREQRIHPGLDDKILTSWNALMLKAYTDAYKLFQEPEFLNCAEANAHFLLQNQFRADNGLNHNYKNGKSTINGYLEDYCFTIEALIALYEATFNEHYLLAADKLMTYCIQHFSDKKSGMFYFTSDEDKALISRKMELSDNVIPASNSSIAKSLFILGHHFEREEYIEMSRKMLSNMLDEMVNYGAGYSNWAMLLLYFVQPFHEIVIAGNNAIKKQKEFSEYYLPNSLFAGSTSESELPLLQNRWTENQTLIYVCSNKTCSRPETEARETLKHIVE